MNMCLETSSPRFSYSLDYDHLDFIPVEMALPPLPASSSYGFEFGTRGSSEFEQSSADELFENGMILPSAVQVRRASRCGEGREQEVPPQPIPFLSPLHLSPSSRGEGNGITRTSSKHDEKIQLKSFWGFRRSSSLDSGHSKRMSFLFPLPVLPRSNSTSSPAAPLNLKRKPSQKHQPSIPRTRNPPSLSGYNCPFPQGSCPPLLRKSLSGGTYYGSSSMKVAPVLNVPPRCTSRGTGNLFGFGCLSLGGPRSTMAASLTFYPLFDHQLLSKTFKRCIRITKNPNHPISVIISIAFPLGSDS